jgi:hypothetical protein
VALCNKGARLTLTGAVAGSSSSGSPRFRLGPIRRTAGPGRRVALVIQLPTSALTALREGQREAIRLTLAATGRGGTSRVSTRWLGLFG